MIEHIIRVTCDRCRHTDEFPGNEVHGRGVRSLLYGVKAVRKWVETPDDKHLCPDCKKSHGKMIDKVNTIKQEYWGK